MNVASSRARGRSVRRPVVRVGLAAILVLLATASPQQLSAQEPPRKSGARRLILEGDPAQLPALDTDADGIPDATDPDRDGDGVPNELDLFPLDAAESRDNDGDGFGDISDLDDDNDGLPDAQDPRPLSDQVGATEITYRVDETGAAVFTVPLPTVAGTAGVVPRLALSYSSREGNGLVGVGWSLGGGSAISRCRQTLASDGQALAITWSAQDRFCLDGQRLVATSGTYGSPGSVYRTEIDRFAEVTATGGTAGHPDSFKVERKDGSISYYGRSPGDASTEAQERNGAGQVLTWAIRRFQDSVGNSIWFRYEDGGDGHRLVEVRYAYGSASGPEGHHARVVFGYEARPDPDLRYVSGHAFATRLRLASVESFNETTSIRRYDLAYLDTNGRLNTTSRLVRIDECVGTKCLPPTEFTWSGDAPVTFASTPTSFTFLSGNRTLTTYELGDFNGDGLLDLIWLQRDTDPEHLRNNLRYALSNGAALVPTPFSDGSGERVIDYNERVDDFVNLIDFNADGRQDVALFNLGSLSWEILLSVPQADGSWRLSAAPIPVPVALGGSLGPSKHGQYEDGTSFADLNSDGLVDALYRPFGATPKVRFLERDPGQPESSSRAYRFGNEHVLPSVFDAYTKAHPFAGGATDFNGDGLTDLVTPFEYVQIFKDLKFLFVEASSPQLFTTGALGTSVSYFASVAATQPCGEGCTISRGAWPADFNGDGLTDIVYTTETARVSPLKASKFLVPGLDSVLYLRLSTGTGLSAPVSLGPIAPGSPKVDVSYDHNRDGHPDLVFYDYMIGALAVRLWTPAEQTFGPSMVLRSQPFSQNEADLFLDFNGDGHTDYVNLKEGSIHTYLATNTAEIPNLITSFTNGHGAVNTFQYGTLSRSAHYERLTIGSPSADTGFTWAGQPYATTMTPSGVTDFYTKLNRGFDLPAGAQTIGKDAPVLELTGSLPIVTAVQGSAPRAGAEAGQVDRQAVSRISYFYGEGKLQASGRGFLGFHTVRTLDEQTGTQTTTTYRQDFPFVGRPWRTEVRTQWGQLLRDSVDTWELEDWNAGAPAAPFHPVLAKVEDRSYALAGNGATAGALLNTLRTSNVHDPHDNLTEILTETLDESGVLVARKRVTNSYGSTAWEQRMSRLSRAVSMHERFDPEGNQSEMRVSSFTYHDSGPLRGLLKTEVLEPDLPAYIHTKSHEYDVFGNKLLTTETAPLAAARTSRVVYDALGRYVNEGYNALGQRVKRVVERDPRGLNLLIEDENGVRTSYEYDLLGRPTLEARAGASPQRTLRKAGAPDCPLGTAFVLAVEKGGAGTTRVCYDLLAREIRTVLPAFDGTTLWQETEYDADGLVRRKSVPHEPSAAANRVFWTTTTYDLLDRVAFVALPDGSSQAMTYPGFVTEVTDALGRTTSERRNALGERVEVVDAIGAMLRYSYDVGGRVRRVKAEGSPSDPRNVSITLAYDLRGRKIALSDPDQGNWSYEYNGFDELIRQTDARKNAIVLDYDALGRTKERKDMAWNAASQTLVEEERTVWTYDSAPHGVGERASVQLTHAGYVDTFGYDEHGRPAQTTTAVTGSGSYRRTLAYDEFGRLRSETDPLDGIAGSSGLRYGYTASGYLSDIVDLASGDEIYRVLQRNVRGQVTQERLGNGVFTDYVYNAATGRLESQDAQRLGSNVQKLRYSWDTLGNLTSRRNQRGGHDIAESFCYDALNRLTKTMAGTTSFDCSGLTSAAQSLRYDTLGNILYKADVGTYSYGSGAGPHAVTSTSAGTTYAYDASGNMISDSSGRQIKYSSFDAATRIQKSGHTVDFAYGPERDRYRRVDTKASGATTTTLYLGNVERVVDSGSSTVKWKRHLSGGAIYTVTTNASNAVVSTDKAYQHKDHLGSPDVLTSATGAVLQEFSFDAFGQRRSPFDGNALSVAARLGFDHSRTTRGFTGHEMLDEVGVIHMNGRIYDATLGRFMQADAYIQSTLDGQLFNRYSYARNNSLNTTDPSGHFLPFLVGAALYLAGAKTSVIVASVFVTAFVETLVQGGTFKDALINGVSSAAFSLVGLEGPGFGFNFDGLLLVGGVGVIGGVTAELQGGKFGAGFVSAGLGAAIGGAVGSFELFKSAGGLGGALLRIGTQAVVGGTISELTGGKFVNGAATAAFTAALAEGSSAFAAAPSGDEEKQDFTLPSVTNKRLYEEGKVKAYTREDGTQVIEINLTYDRSGGFTEETTNAAIAEIVKIYDNKKFAGGKKIIRATLTKFQCASGDVKCLLYEKPDITFVLGKKLPPECIQSRPACAILGGDKIYTTSSMVIAGKTGGTTFPHEVSHILGLEDRGPTAIGINSYNKNPALRTLTEGNFDELFDLYTK